MRITTKDVEEMSQNPYYTASQIAFIKLLEGNDMPSTYFVKLVTMAKTSTAEEMETYANKNQIFVKSYFLKALLQDAERLK